MQLILRLPFRGEYPLTFGFGAIPDNPVIKEQYARWGLVGHNALDYGLPEGTEVLATDGGKVIQSGENGDFGISVTLEHSWGQSLYAHLQEAKVSKDQEVKSGEVVGLSGQTGNAFGPHLHFAIKFNGGDVQNGYLGYTDPTPYFAKKENPYSPSAEQLKDLGTKILREYQKKGNQARRLPRDKLKLSHPRGV